MFCCNKKVLSYEERLDKVFEKHSIKNLDKLLEEYPNYDHIYLFFKLMNDCVMWDYYDHDTFYMHVLGKLKRKEVDKIKDVNVFREYFSDSANKNLETVYCRDGKIIFKKIGERVSKPTDEYDRLIDREIAKISVPIHRDWYKIYLSSRKNIRLLDYYYCLRNNRGIFYITHFINSKYRDGWHDFTKELDRLFLSDKEKLVVIDKIPGDDIINSFRTFLQLGYNPKLMAKSYISRYGYDSKIMRSYKQLQKDKFDSSRKLFAEYLISCLNSKTRLTPESYMFLLDISVEYDNIDHFTKMVEYANTSSSSSSSDSIDINDIIDYAFKRIVYYTNSYTILRHIVEEFDYDFTFSNYKVARFAAAYHKHELCSCFLELCYHLDSTDETNVRDIINKDHVQKYHANKISEMKVANSLKEKEIAQARENAYVIAKAIYSIAK